MFKIFKNQKHTSELNNGVIQEVMNITQLETWKAPKKKIQTEKELIAEIHDSFYTEVEKLLNLANTPNLLDTKKQELIDKTKRLKALGFTNTKEAIEGNLEIKRLGILQNENEQKKELKRAILYFSQKYPNYKFITEESIHTICGKYGLIMGDSNQYIGTIPDVNLKHMEDFSISDEDQVYYIKSEERYGSRTNKIVKNYISSEQIYQTFINNQTSEDKNYRNYYYDNINDVINLRAYRKDINKEVFTIVAPLKDFNIKDHEMINNKLVQIVEKDPVVLCSVMYENKKYSLIVTAWGLEASDELVLNSKHN